MNPKNGNTEKIAMVVGSPTSMESDDDDDNCQSSASSSCEETTDLMKAVMDNDVTAQLAAAGPIGVAAAAAILSAKKRKQPHTFETNPSKRKRLQKRLLGKLRQTIDEFTTRIGEQAIVLVATPGKASISYKVFGAKPLEDVMKNLRDKIMEDFKNALVRQAPPPLRHDPLLFELPPLIVDGIPTAVEKMTQSQLRAFIPLMLKYSTGRERPKWGSDSTRPPWWPKELPWANIRMDSRTKDEKQKISWTLALRQAVLNCYKFHGREDLLPIFSAEDEMANAAETADANVTTKYTPTVLYTNKSLESTINIVQVDPSNPIITLPDGTTVYLQGVTTVEGQGDDTPVHTIQTIAEDDGQEKVIDLNTVTKATFKSEGQIILTGEDRYENTVITVPVPSLMYHAIVTNIQPLHTNSDGTVCVKPVVPVAKMEPNTGDNNMEVTQFVDDIKKEETISTDQPFLHNF